jgi:hypothetical protein
MALDFPNSPTNGQVYTDSGSGEQWVYDAPTNSWTSKGLVNTSGGLVFKGSLDITAAPPTGISAGWQYNSSTTGTPNAGFTGITGTVNKGDVVMYTGSGWILQSHTVPDATALVKGIDTKKWSRTGTELSPATAGDSVFTTGGVKVGGTTAAPNITLKADGGIVVNTDGLVYDSTTKRLGIGVIAPTELLEVRGSAALNSAATLNTPAALKLIINNNGATGGYYGGIAWYNYQWDGTKRAEISSGNDGGVSAGYLAFSTGATGVTERMRIGAVGNVLIGGTLPASPNITLSAAGNINAKGAAARVYADNTAAKAGGLVDGDIYRKADGTLMIAFT